MPTTRVAEMIAEARSNVRNLSKEEVAAALVDGDVVLVDLREAVEREAGTIPGSVHVPRGMLEFHADAASPYHHEALVPTGRIILFCASGGRSALAAQTLQRMGYTNVAHLDGGFNAWPK